MKLILKDHWSSTPGGLGSRFSSAFNQAEQIISHHWLSISLTVKWDWAQKVSAAPFSFDILGHRWFSWLVIFTFHNLNDYWMNDLNILLSTSLWIRDKYPGVLATTGHHRSAGQLGLELDLEHWVKFGEKALLTISWQSGFDCALVWLAIFCFLLLSGVESSLLVPFSVLCSQGPLISP